MWPVSHTSSLPMEKARFLHALLHGDSIDLPTFICHHILRAFRVLGHRIGLPYIYLIHCLVTSLRTTFPNGVSRWVSYPRGQVTISQSRSHVPLSSAPTVLAKPADSSVPADPIGDLLSGGSIDIPIPPSQPIVPIDILSSYNSILPPPTDSIPESTSIHVDSSIALMVKCLCSSSNRLA